MASLYFRHGVMGSGKSAALLQVVHNYTEKGMKCLLLQPRKGDKGQGKVKSRIGIERPIDYLITPTSDIYNFVKHHMPNAVVVDEAQFLEPEQVEQLYFITKKLDIPVLAYGLRCDFQMKGFPGAARLLELADHIEELRTICKCGRRATQNLRLLNGTPIFQGVQVALDKQNNITYESVCGNCYLDLLEKYGGQ